MSASDIDTAHELIARHDLVPAFDLLTRVVADPQCAPNVKADAYQLLGVIVIIDPKFGETDEFGSSDDSGLSFFKRAIELCPDHFSALHGIVLGFGELSCDHQDVGITEYALHKLMQQSSELSRDELKFIERRSEALKRYLEKNGGNK
jgi:hypothetical protein